MSIVSHRASKANRLHAELPTNRNQDSADIGDHSAEVCITVPRDALGSPIQTHLEIGSPPDPREYISGYAQLSKHGVGFYPIHSDKSPAISGRLNREVTTDPLKIRYWAEYRHRQNFAMRLRAEFSLNSD